MVCDVCGAKVNNPESSSHIESKKHQIRLIKTKKSREQLNKYPELQTLLEKMALKVEEVEYEVESNKVVHLTITGKNLTQLPPEIGSLVHLKKLDFSFNKIAELPIEIANLENLHVFILEENMFTEIPKEIASLPNLQLLDLQSNKISMIKENTFETQKFQRLGTLNLSKNQISILPNSFENLLSLRHLHLDGNLIQHLPIELIHMELKILNVTNNPKLQEISADKFFTVYEPIIDTETMTASIEELHNTILQQQIDRLLSEGKPINDLLDSLELVSHRKFVIANMTKTK